MPWFVPSSNLIVAIPYPGRGHINPMMKFCEHLILKGEDVRIIFIVTEEWLGLLSSKESSNSPDKRISFLTIPNVLPSERARGSDHTGFVEAVQRKMAGPVEQVLDTLQAQHPDMIIADTFVGWAVEVGARRNIPVATFWPMAASVLTLTYQHNLITESQYYPLDVSGQGQEWISLIPGIAPIRLADLPTFFRVNSEQMLKLVIECVAKMSKAQFVILRTIEELEKPAIEALRNVLPQPIYPIGPAIPYFKAKCDSLIPNENQNEPDYFEWLNHQPERSVLYVSLGSYLSTSGAQLEEFAAGLRDSGKSVLWVAREEASIKLCTSLGKKGMVIPWCDQTRVLIHPSVGGFLTHCGWNSTLESAFAGVPVLTFPLGADQTQNDKMMVEDWGTGWRLRRNACGLVGKDEICETVKSFMDLRRDERKLLDKNCETLNEILLQSVDEGGTTTALRAFLSEHLSSETPQ